MQGAPVVIRNDELLLTKIHLQKLRAEMLVTLNRKYPNHLDIHDLHSLYVDRRRTLLKRELFYLTELGFLHKSGKRWRITAAGRDFLLGLVEAKGIMDPAELSNIGERC